MQEREKEKKDLGLACSCLVTHICSVGIQPAFFFFFFYSYQTFQTGFFGFVGKRRNFYGKKDGDLKKLFLKKLRSRIWFYFVFQWPLTHLSWSIKAFILAWAPSGIKVIVLKSSNNFFLFYLIHRFNMNWTYLSSLVPGIMCAYIDFSGLFLDFLSTQVSWKCLPKTNYYRNIRAAKLSADFLVDRTFDDHLVRHRLLNFLPRYVCCLLPLGMRERECLWVRECVCAWKRERESTAQQQTDLCEGEVAVRTCGAS